MHCFAAWQKINSKNAFDWNLIDYLSDICNTSSKDTCFSVRASLLCSP